MVNLIYLLTIINICVICVSTDSSSSASARAQASSSSSESSSSAESSAESDDYNDDYSNEEQNPPCGENEMYSSCSNGGCRRFKCSIPPLCIDLVEGGCTGGCICIDKYTRDDNGKCIPEDQCPLTCKGVNEVPGCERSCPPESCESIDRQYKCKPQAAICKPKCQCRKNYYRNKYSECVSKSDCQYENAVKKLSQGNVDFTEAFLYAASSLNPGASVVYSPFSLTFLLAQLALYASGISLNQLLSVINLSQSSIRSTIPKYLTELNTQTNVNFSLAEKVYVNYNYKLSKNFLRDTKNIFFSEAKNLDFSQPIEAAKEINDWVKNKTNDLIQDLVSPDSLSGNTRIVLADAIYFKANWKLPFKNRNTRETVFFVNENKNVTVKMMNQVGYFQYADIPSLNIQAAQLQYKNPDFSYLVLLPKSINGLGDLLEKIRKTSNSVLQDVLSNLKFKSINLSLPSIKTTTSTDIKEVFNKLNITALFDPNTSGLNGIFEVPEKLGVSSAIQKAAIIVNESGSEAAAGNAIVITKMSAIIPSPDTIVFNANHPYAHFIMYQDTPLFSGIFTGM